MLPRWDEEQREVGGLLIALLFFLVATGYSWWRFKQRIEEEEQSEGMTAVDTLEQAVEALCGDLSSIRAPRGHPQCSLVVDRGPLRMLLNNLDAEVAERPRTWSSTAAPARRRATTTRSGRSFAPS